MFWFELRIVDILLLFKKLCREKCKINGLSGKLVPNLVAKFFLKKIFMIRVRGFDTCSQILSPWRGI